MNVSICDTSLRPLNPDFEGSGTVCALIRLCEEMAEHYKMPSIPVWVVEDRLTSVLGSEAETGTGGNSDMHSSALELIPKLARLEEAILADLELVAKQNHNKRTRVEYTPGNEEERSSSHTTVSLIGFCRLLLGACCEAYAALACCRLYLPIEKAERTKDARRARRLHIDSCMAATWTSAHAQYLSDLSHHSITATMPTVHSVPSELGELDLSGLYSMRTSIKSVFSSESQHLLALMSRCTNPGNRGWDSVVKQSLEKSVGTRRIAYNAFMISITGMHSCVHPAHRLHWKERAVLIASMSRVLPLNSLSEVAMQCIVQFKECMRRMVSNCISGNYAMVAALAYVDHPVALLQPSPLVMPMDGLKASTSAFVNAGYSFLRHNGRVSMVDCIKASFSSPSTGHSGESDSCLEWSAGSLGARIGTNHTRVTPASPSPMRVACHRKRYSFNSLQGSGDQRGRRRMGGRLSSKLRPLLDTRVDLQDASPATGPSAVQVYTFHERRDAADTAAYRSGAHGDEPLGIEDAVVGHHDTGGDGFAAGIERNSRLILQRRKQGPLGCCENVWCIGGEKRGIDALSLQDGVDIGGSHHL